MIKLSDYVVQELVRRGVRHIFLVSGGGIMHLLDSVGRDPRLKYICNYHEQASAIAAEAYARTSNRIGVCLVTTGPGAVNALSGVIGAWFDSVPVLVLSGQVRTQLLADYTKLRQFGPQEANILPMVRPVTKHAVQVRDPATIAEELDRAFTAACAGRPGPVWIDLPLDMQAATIDERALGSRSKEAVPAATSFPDLFRQVATALDLLGRSKRPVLVLGNGIRLARAEKLMARLLDRTRIPVLLPIGGMDLVPESYPWHLGAFGPYGRRAANFAVQNADLLLSIGAGLTIAAIGFNTAGFAPSARKIVVNVDEAELTKPNLSPDLAIPADAGAFLEELLRQSEGRVLAGSERWLQACRDWKRRYPPTAESRESRPGFVNSYSFADALSDLLDDGDVVVTGNSLDACSIYQAFRVKPGQRILISVNTGAMGWDLPAAVGACVAHGGRVVLVTGDGSLQFNIQELLTLKQYALPVKIFVFNNEGYEAIRATQTNFFDGRFVGASRESGVGNPDFAGLAAAYGLGYDRVCEDALVPEVGRRVLAADGPILCEVLVSPTQVRSPKVSAFRRPDGTLESRPLEDMAPFLPREEVALNMSLFTEEDG
jgi:acetolactate synthase-1/2/3 large subunit